jgi:hypothetical protein
VTVNTVSSTVLGSYKVTVTAVDACGAQTSRSFTLTVRSAACPIGQWLTFVADTDNNRVQLIASAPAPGAGAELCTAGAQLGKVSGPEGVTVASFIAGPLAGVSTLAVSDTLNSRIQAASLPACAWMLLGGGPGAGAGQFKLPSKIR